MIPKKNKSAHIMRVFSYMVPTRGLINMIYIMMLLVVIIDYMLLFKFSNCNYFAIFLLRIRNF